MPQTGISIWFFVGVLLAIYGALIGGYGVYELISGHTAAVALANLHAPVWWGGTQFFFGVLYCIRFRPGRANS